jgi:hypothetical protein
MEVWPDRYFELFGSLRDVEIERPAQPDPKYDVPRKTMQRTSQTRFRTEPLVRCQERERQRVRA